MRIISQQLLTLLFNSLWQIALIAAVATLCARLLRGAKAGTRHRLWVAALLAPVCLTAVTFWLGMRQDLFALTPAASKITFSQAIPVNRLPINLYADESLLPLPAPEKTIPVGKNVALALITSFVLFLAFRSIQFLLAWLNTRAIVRGAHEAEMPAHFKGVIDQCLETIGIAKVRVLWSPAVTVPITIGALRPVVILPENMLVEIDTDLITAALGHELAHVRRRDYAFNFLYELLYIPISFHPAAAWVKRRVRQTREQRCDELVTEKLLNGAAYARSLVKLAGLASPIAYSTPTISIGIMDAGNLEERVMSILRKPRINARKKGFSIAAASLLFAIPCIAAAPHILRVSINSSGESPARALVSAPPASYAPTIATISPARQEGVRQDEAASKSQENRDNPRCTYCPMPEYSAEAREKKIEGDVSLEVTVGTDGKAHDIKITKTLFPSLDNKAVEVVKTWRFEPAMKDGKPVEKRTPIRVAFLLDASAEDESRGTAERAALEDRERELKARLDNEDKAILQGQALKLRVLKQQIEDLERSEEQAAAANDAEGQRRATEKLAQIQNMLINQEREAELLQQKDAQMKEELQDRAEGQNQLDRFVNHEPDEKRATAEFKHIQAGVAGRVKIPMASAIEIATKDHPGTVVNCDLRGSPDQIFYAITIVFGDEQHRQGVVVLVSAIDGKILAGRSR
jgi:TonB family protein